MSETQSTALLIILLILGFSFVLETLLDALDLLQLRRRRFPPGNEKIYSANELERAIRYHSEWRRFSLFKRTLHFALLIAFILAGGFGSVDELARRWTGAEAAHAGILTAIVFVAVLMLLRGALDLPFSIYGTFVIEERYGFNRTTPRTFALDLLKGILLGAVIGIPLFLAVVWFFEKTGPAGWLPAWATLSVAQLAIAYLAPAILLPLFNRFTPLPAGELREGIDAFCQKVNFQLSGIFQMDGSRRTSKANAFFTGFGRFRRLALFDTLMEKLSTRELLAVLAHEIGHFKERHILKFMLISIAASGLSFYILSFFIGNAPLTRAFGLTHVSVYATLVFVGLLYSPVTRVLGVAVSTLSRRFEYEADRYSAENFGEPETLASALLKISTDALANPAPHPLRVVMDYSHPPVLERVRALTIQSARGP